MSGKPEPAPEVEVSREPSLEELLDNTPEALASRRLRAARAQAARAAAAEARERAERAKPSALRRRLVVGGLIGLATAAGLLSRAAGTARRP